MTDDQVFADAKIISEYLGINCPKLKLNPDSTEGLTLSEPIAVYVER